MNSFFIHFIQFEIPCWTHVNPLRQFKSPSTNPCAFGALSTRLSGHDKSWISRANEWREKYVLEHVEFKQILLIGFEKKLTGIFIYLFCSVFTFWVSKMLCYSPVPTLDITRLSSPPFLNAKELNKNNHLGLWNGPRDLKPTRLLLLY